VTVTTTDALELEKAPVLARVSRNLRAASTWLVSGDRNVEGSGGCGKSRATGVGYGKGLSSQRQAGAFDG